MPVKLIVAFKTRLADGFDPATLQFSAPSNYKDPDKIAAYIAERRAAAAVEAANSPFLGTFDEVQITIAQGPNVARDATRWAYRAPDSGRQPVCQAVREWLVTTFPKAWQHGLYPEYPAEAKFQLVEMPSKDKPVSTVSVSTQSRVAPVIFLGFNPRLFLKMLGLECAKPTTWPPGFAEAVAHGDEPITKHLLPAEVYYDNADNHRDLTRAVMPEGYPLLSWPVVLNNMGLAGMFPQWTGPHADVRTDIKVALELAGRLGWLEKGG